MGLGVGVLQIVRFADKEAYQKVGEATEVALRMLAEKIGLQGFDRMPSALSQLSRQDRATFCNDYWNQEYRKAGPPSPNPAPPLCSPIPAPNLTFPSASSPFFD
jgi:hypothetical protein